jgi:2-oxoisovalerate dehydrogenase E2 component (dihydrolipoyl transacylase)
MPTEIKMPQLGESVHEGTLGRWLKNPGDPVAKYEPLVEVNTDKVNVEMPSPYAGVLAKILVQEGQTVTTGTVIALVEEQSSRASAQAASAPPATAGAVQAPAPPVRPQSPDGERAGGRSPARLRDHAARLSPLVRRLADEHRIRPEELEAIEGTGSGGRITKEDVLHYLERRGAAPSGAAPTSPAAVGVSAASGAAPRASESAVAERPHRAPGDQLHPLSALRRTTADRMARSAREIPHAYGVIEVDVTTLVRHRDAHKTAWRERDGVNVSVTAFLVRAATRALRAFPTVNSTFTPDGILYRQAINLGIGVAIPDGLIVAVIKDADQKSVVGLAREIEALVGRARHGKLTLDDVSGGTFTLTNPGIFGSVFSMPIINYPQAAILAADAIVRRPVVVGEGIAIREIMHLGLAFDHRVFDGAVGMQFLTRIKQQLEEFAPVGDSPEF